ncbi:MAG: GTPase [Corynebacterium glucuronolyticum]|nr:dynamin family protein [Mycobacteriaceae bacterium]MDY5835320.1 GTPase [Corynebacterium glucuronolyticum]
MNDNALDTIVRLRDGLKGVGFSTDPESKRETEAIIDQIDDYILPRLKNVDAPLLAVIGGSTGSGKSTLVNALVGKRVSRSGVIRPTTRQPVLVSNPADAEWFNSPHVLPGLAREHGDPDQNPEATSLRTVVADSLTPGLALLDAPDFDSIEDRNRALATQLLAAADLWIFVTTPARYADQLVWNFLHDAAGRDLQVIVVLNKVEDDSGNSVPNDLRRMMDEAQLHEAELIVIPDAGHIEELLPHEHVAELSNRLSTLAADAAARREMAGKTLFGAVGKLEERVTAIATVKRQQETFAEQLNEGIADNYEAATRQVLEATSDGQLLRKEVLNRWQDFVGTSDVFRTVERLYAQAIDRIGRFFSGQPEPVREVETEIEEGLHAVIVDAAETGATRSWGYIGSNAPMLREGADPTLAHASRDIGDRASSLVREWQGELMRDIEDSAGDKRMKARIMSFGINAATVALMLVVFAGTAGLTGGEVAIAGGSAVVGQKLLETIFGEDAVRRMANKARASLNKRVNALFADEAERYYLLTDHLGDGTPAATLTELASEAVSHVHNQAKGGK